jgi:hypothetical protein
VVVVVVVIVLLIVINGKSPGTGPGAGVVTGPTVVHGLPTPTPDASTSATTGAVVSPSVVPYSPTPVTSPRGTASHPSSRPAVATGTARAPVVVLNNSRISGLAHQVAGELAAKGWQIESVGNAQGRLAQTTLYYPTGEHAAARHLAHDFPSIQAIRSADAAGIRSHGNDLTLVVTRYWT